MNSTIMSFENIGKSYGDKVVFENLSFNIDQGDFVTIIGKSGTGKSTLLNIMGLIDTNTEGDFTIFGKKNININSKDALLLRRTKIGYLFQNFALVEDETVYYNLCFALEYKAFKKSEKRGKIEEVLEKVNLKDLINQKVFKLSGGEQQRVAIARLMLQDSEIILADEPTGSLDSGNRDLILSYLKDFNLQGKTILLVTHDEYIANMSKKIIQV